MRGFNFLNPRNLQRANLRLRANTGNGITPVRVAQLAWSTDLKSIIRAGCKTVDRHRGSRARHCREWVIDEERMSAVLFCQGRASFYLQSLLTSFFTRVGYRHLCRPVTAQWKARVNQVRYGRPLTNGSVLRLMLRGNHD
jgi:hypothetical protein